MATNWHLEPLSGTVDGVNKTFTASTGFTDGTEVVFIRGLPRIKSYDDGWTVIDASAGIIELNEAPLPGDDIMMAWSEDGPQLVETEISELLCYISEVEQVISSVIEVEQMVAIAANHPLTGIIEVVNVTGQLFEVQEISVATIEEAP